MTFVSCDYPLITITIEWPKQTFFFLMTSVSCFDPLMTITIWWPILTLPLSFDLCFLWWPLLTFFGDQCWPYSFHIIPVSCDEPLMTLKWWPPDDPYHLVKHTNPTPFFWPLFPVMTPTDLYWWPMLTLLFSYYPCFLWWTDNDTWVMTPWWPLPYGETC